MTDNSRPKYPLVIICCIILLVIHGCGQNRDNHNSTNSKLTEGQTVDSSKSYVISKIIDGDTYEILIEETEYKVRLIGVDTPESSYNFKTKSDAEKTRMAIKEIIMMGKTATKFVKKYLSAGDSVRIEFDIQTFDRYNRILAYVYLMDGRMINEILVREGYAQIMTIPPNVKYQNLFLEAQRDARNNNRGFWSDSLGYN